MAYKCIAEKKIRVERVYQLNKKVTSRNLKYKKGIFFIFINFSIQVCIPVSDKIIATKNYLNTSSFN